MQPKGQWITSKFSETDLTAATEKHKQNDEFIIKKLPFFALLIYWAIFDGKMPLV